MSIVVLADSSFLPALDTAKLPTKGNRTAVQDALWGTFLPTYGDEAVPAAKYVTSPVLEIDVGQQPPGFMLDLFIKPSFQIVSFLKINFTAL